MARSKKLPWLQKPLVRVGARGEGFREASWDEALDRAAEGVARVTKKLGPDGFGVFSCSKSTNEMNYAAQKLARVAVGTNNIDSCNRT